MRADERGGFELGPTKLPFDADALQARVLQGQKRLKTRQEAERRRLLKSSLMMFNFHIFCSFSAHANKAQTKTGD